MAKSRDNMITATELVRNLSATIDKVRITGKSLYITKGSHTIAELMPPPKSGFPVSQLAGLLKALPKLGDDASVMTEDLKNIRQQADLPDGSWD